MSDNTVGKYSFETGVYRPPSEGGSCSLLIRVTRNCPWNKCAFCSMYKEEKFSLRSSEEIKRDIDAIASLCERLQSISIKLGEGGRVTREVAMEMMEEEPSLSNSHGFAMVINWLNSGGKTAFLQDANSMVMKTDKLVEVLTCLRETFPALERVTTYARSKSLARKELEELIKIREAGLDRLHVGLETGDDELLAKIKKGVTSEEQIIGGKRAMEAGFQLSEYWMPGLGGKKMWKQHAHNTTRVLNEINPDYIRSRPFFPLPGSPLLEEYERGELELLSPAETLEELKLTIEGLDVASKVCFDHAGNYWRNRSGGNLFSLDYEGYQFPEKKEMVLRLIDLGMETN
ncbi:MAG: radical SAM protein [Desulfobacterales bacterium]